MIDSTEFALAVVIGGIGTYLIRALPMVFAERLANLPPRARLALTMIPPAAFAALVVPAVLRVDGELELFGPRLVAATAAGLIGWRTRSVAWTLLVGLGLLGGLQQVW